MKVSRITKIAGVTFVGFCAASVAADKVNLGPVASQLAGFLGAFAGSLVARKQVKPDEKPETKEASTKSRAD